MASGKAKRINNVVDITQNYTCQSASWEYTGVSIEIPAYACYGLMGGLVFQNTLPQGAAFSFSSTDMASYNAVGVAEVANTCVCGCNNSANSITLYLWGKWAAPSANIARISGWIGTS